MQTWAPNYHWFHAAQNSPILTGAIDAAMGGRGEAVLLTGEAGVGKTRLLVEARLRPTVGKSWCSEAGPSNPAEPTDRWWTPSPAHRHYSPMIRLSSATSTHAGSGGAWLGR